MKKVKLPEPVKRGDKLIEEITLREPVAGTLRGLETVAVLRMDYAAHQTLIPRICPDLTKDDIANMSPKTLLAVQSEVVGFFVD
ncbi:MAG: phage tail assembly protein [Aeromonadaceae bacterium]